VADYIRNAKARIRFLQRLNPGGGVGGGAAEAAEVEVEVSEKTRAEVQKLVSEKRKKKKMNTLTRYIMSQGRFGILRLPAPLL
jgi:hypothetical protein